MSDFDISDVIHLAEEQVAGEPIDLSDSDGRRVAKIFVLRENHGDGQRLETVDLEEFEPRPYAKVGIHKTFDPASFIGVVLRYADEAGTTIWADKNRGFVEAILDDHEKDTEATSGLAAWGRHRTTLQLTHTQDWTHWLSGDGQMMGQVEFAEFIEQGALCLTDPDPATFYEIALSLRANTAVDFKSSYVLESGEIGFRYEETTAASAGQKGELPIPRAFTLELKPFEGGMAYPLAARLMYRTGQGGLKLGYRLIRPREVLTLAFDEIGLQIATGTGLPVFAGIARQ